MACLNNPLACQRLYRYKQASCTAALVLVIKSFRLACLHRQRLDDFPLQLHRQLIKADNRTLFIQGQTLQAQDLLHTCQVLASNSAYAPLLVEVRLEAVFFSIFLTAVCEMLSTKPSSTALSASSRNVQLV